MKNTTTTQVTAAQKAAVPGVEVDAQGLAKVVDWDAFQQHLNKQA